MFASYHPGLNGQVVEYLCRCAGSGGEPPVFLAGGAGTGKTHLLQAVCHAAGERGVAAVYLPLEEIVDRFPCESLDGMENVAVVCIDDVQAIAGRDDWETALLKLYERIQERNGSLVVSGDGVPAELGLGLPQLGSRLAWGMVFQLRSLGDQDRLQALTLRAARRGFDLPAETGRYLVRHYGRDMAALFTALDSLDRASLAAQRKLTIPFIRGVLSKAGPIDPGG